MSAQLTASPRSRIALARAANRRIDLQTGVDSTYRNQIKRFKGWIEVERSKPGASAQLGGRGETYTTTSNIDLFFSEEVSKRTCQPQNARKALLAIIKLARNEHDEEFECESEVVKDALKSQKEVYAKSLGVVGDKIGCPVAGLPTNILQHKDNVVAMKYILSCRDDWYNVGPTWLWGTSAYVRGCSMRKFNLSELIYLDGWGPETTGPLAPILGLVLRKGPIHKERFKQDHVVAAFRDRDYFLCPLGITAFSLMYRLRKVGQRLHFFATRHEEPHFWRKFPIIEWARYTDEYNIIKQILKACDLRASKVTHFRQSGVALGGWGGLLVEATSSMAKHFENKHQKCYRPELRKDVMHIMASFGKDEAYFCKRAGLSNWLQTPWGFDIALNFLFPHLQTWKNQAYGGPHGDDCDGSRDFLELTVPFMARLILEDGVFFIKDFPNHPCSQILMQLPGYEAWARVARTRVDARVARSETDKISALNAGAAAAFLSTNRRIDVLEQRQQQILEAQKTYLEEGARRHAELMAALALRNAAGPATPAAPAQVGPAPILPRPPNNAAANLPALVRRGEMRRNAPRLGDVNTFLGSTRKQPPIDGSLPKSFEDLVIEHRDLELAAWENKNKQGWEGRVQQAFGKRVFLMAHLKRCAARFQRQQDPVLTAARKLDLRRANTAESVAQVHSRLKNTSPSTIRRPGGEGARPFRPRSVAGRMPRARARVPGVRRTRGEQILGAGMRQVAPPVPTTAQRNRQAVAQATANSIVETQLI